MGPRHRPASAALLGGFLLLAAAGCTADTAEATLDRATGAVLADGADRLAEALEADDACRALLEADALRERAARAHEAGDAPDDVVAETTRVVAATTGALTCEVDTEPAPEADETDETDETDEAAEADETDAADPGDEASPEPAPAPAPSPDEEPQQETQDEEKEKDGDGGPSGPDRGQGPGGDGPPGHRDDRGGG